MSKLEVDAIEPQSGTTITIGAAGDTVNLIGTLQSNGSPLPGDISEVVAGTGLSGGGTTGAVTINIDSAQPTITSLGTITSFRSTGIDDNADATAITIDSSERVGIGNTSPTGALDVKSGTQPQLKVATASATADRNAGFLVTASNSATPGSRSVVLSLDADGGDGSGTDNLTITKTGGGGDATITNQNNANIVFGTNNAEKMRLTSTGLGIGTSSPGSLLHLSSNGPQIKLTDSDTGATHNLNGSSSVRNFDLQVDHSGSSGNPRFSVQIQGGLYYTQTKTDTVFNEESNDVDFRVESNGNASMLFVDGGANRVGIGTSSPGATLETIGTAGNNFKYATSGTYFSILPEAANGNVSLRFRANSGSAPDLIFKNDAASEVVRIQNSGNVGIGTSAPDGTLHVQNGSAGSVTAYSGSNLTLEASGSNNFLSFLSPANQNQGILFGDADSNFRGQVQYSHTNDYMGFFTSASEAMRITSAGSVGIGTSIVLAKLHVDSGNSGVTPSANADELFIEGSANSGITIASGTSSVGQIMFADSGDNDIGGISYNHNDNSMRFTAGAGERMAINGSGNVGIGTTSPSEKLEVSGTVKATSFTGSGANLTNLPASGASYLTTSTTSTTSQFNPSGSFGTMLTRTFTVSSGKSATVIVSAGSHGMWEGNAGQMEGRITLSGASSQTGTTVGCFRGDFSNFAGDYSVSQGFRVTTSGAHTINYQAREANGEVRINYRTGATSFLTITVFED